MITELIRGLQERGVVFRVVDTDLHVKGPHGVVSPESRQALAEFKTEVIAALTMPEVPCVRCQRPSFWRDGFGKWRCIGCEPPAAWDDIREMLRLAFDDSGPFGVEEAQRAGCHQRVEPERGPVVRVGRQRGGGNPARERHARSSCGGGPPWCETLGVPG